jgi:hypothetical protein
MSDSQIDESESRDRNRREFLGDKAGTVEILGDVVSPRIDLDEIEAYRES